MIRFKQLESITGGNVLKFSEDTTIESLCVDSRKAGISKGTLFFAIRGDRHNGHAYLTALHATGIRQFVVEEEVDLAVLPDANIIRVPSSVSALQALAAFHRAQFSIPVIGITGSNGKTIIKEWLYQMLSADRIIVKNPGSYNSQVGVPLSIWQLQRHHQLGIFEAGISKPDEMDKLEKMVRPTIGIFANLGSAHDEGFANREEKAREKLKLFKHCDTLIFCIDHEEITAAVSSAGIKLLTWGSKENADVRWARAHQGIRVTYRGHSYTLALPFDDTASTENLMHCITTMLHLGYSFADIQSRLHGLRAVHMRMELKESINHCQLIDDTYNTDLGGLEIALQFLANQHQKKRKRLIISDILESGLEDEVLVKEISTMIVKHGIDAVVGIGPVLHKFSNSFPSTSLFLMRRRISLINLTSMSFTTR